MLVDTAQTFQLLSHIIPEQVADALNGRPKITVLQVSCLERSPHGGQLIVRLLVVVEHKEEPLPNFFGLAHP